MRLFITACLLAPAAAATADEVRFASGAERVALIELYTSEGCSSCPPADRWLSGLRDDAGLWTRFTPAAFHVDYWNYIGWTDRFATARYSDRQRRHASDGNTGGVYTPGFVTNGREWRGFFSGRALDPAHPVVGDLVTTVAGEQVVIEFEPAAPVAKPLDIHVALLGMGLETDVGAGENRGRTLKHDFVVLDLVTSRLEIDDEAHVGRLALPASDLAGRDTALVAWVTESGSLVPLQSVGGYLPRQSP